MPTTATGEVNRLLRHAVPVAVILGVERGWVPEAMQGPLTEIGLILVTLAVSYVASILSDRARERAARLAARSPESE